MVSEKSAMLFDQNGLRDTLPTQESVMFAGTFSYFNDNTFTYPLDGSLRINLARIDTAVARLYFVNREGRQVPVPENVALNETVSQSRVPVYNNEFLIAWTGNYELRRGSEIVLNLDVQRQQAIRVPRKSQDEALKAVHSGEATEFKKEDDMVIKM
jgi:hypothetical protein